MTKRINIALDPVSLVWLYETLEAAKERDITGVGWIIDETMAFVDRAMLNLELLERSTLLLEHDDFLAYEHPDRGDEAPVILYDRRRCKVHVQTPFFEATKDCADEILDWLDSES